MLELPAADQQTASRRRIRQVDETGTATQNAQNPPVDEKSTGTAARKSTGAPMLDTAQRGNAFQLIASGEIEGAEMSTTGPLMCTFLFHSGSDWTVTEGLTQGMTQASTSSLASKSRSPSVVWNFPFGFSMKSTNAFGWPRLVVSVYGNDICNRRVIKGYGSVHVPCQPGRHERTIRLFCPVSSSLWVRFLGYITGNPAQFVDPRVVSAGEGREMLRVASDGKLTVIFNVMLKDLKRFNYAVG
eukprot:GEMP01100016.1.p1 GENE.GEMP01100016.1~~GEMP01100016.1.p1  ORF type:complete len:243 (+),score=25.42 GEMP01100016.1:42-770(+)